jgi:hypothetical protein
MYDSEEQCLKKVNNVGKNRQKKERKHKKVEYVCTCHELAKVILA